MSHTRFKVNLNSVVAWMSRNSLLETGTASVTDSSDCNGIWTHNYLVRKLTLKSVCLSGWVFVYECLCVRIPLQS